MIHDTNLFDGRGFAREREERLRGVVVRLKRKPRMVSFLVGDDPASQLYTGLKQKAAERVGVGYHVSSIMYQVSWEELRGEIRKVSKEYDGVMVQLPLPENLREKTGEILEAIPVEKDVDGLRWEESGMVPATVRAISSILEEIERRGERGLWQRQFVVVGAGGMVGKPLVYFLRRRGVEVSEVEIDTPEEERKKLLREAEVLISCVGKPGLIKAGEVSEGVVAVDVGISTQNSKGKTQNYNQKLKIVTKGKRQKAKGGVRGDMERGVYEKARVAVPVPGGVGPVTVVSLLENLVLLIQNSKLKTSTKGGSAYGGQNRNLKFKTE